MSKALRLSTMALVGATAAGVIGFTAPAMADDSGSGTAFKREDDTGQVITTKHGSDDDDDDDADTSTGTSAATGGDTGTSLTSTGSDSTSTGTGSSTSADQTMTNTGTRTRGGDTDHSRVAKVKDLTKDGPGKRAVDHSRGHTNDGSRHNTRG